MMSAKVNLRPVEKKDYRKIFEWRNESKVRRGMFITRRISWREHKRFWDNLLKNKNRFAFVIELGGQDLGVVRLDRVGSIAEVDIFVSSKYQGRGIGTNAIKEVKKKAEELNIDKLIAKVKPDNKPSIKTFENSGFELKHLYYEVEIGGRK